MAFSSIRWGSGLFLNNSNINVLNSRSLGKLTKFVYPWMNRRKPYWVDQKSDPLAEEDLTKENIDFLSSERSNDLLSKIKPLKLTKDACRPWKPLETQRCGLIALKLGIYPMWTKDGEKVDCTILQVSAVLAKCETLFVMRIYGTFLFQRCQTTMLFVTCLLVRLTDISA